MSRDAVLAHREAMHSAHMRTRTAAALIASAQARWWRPVRYWRRMRAARALLAGNDAEQENIAAAWAAMSPSERAAENARALRGAAVSPPPHRAG